MQTQAQDLSSGLGRNWRDLYKTYLAPGLAVKTTGTDLKDLREGLTDSGLREHLGPFLVRVEKFSLDFIREPADAERAKSLFSPWVAQLVGLRAEPLWRIPGGFAVLQRWCCGRYALALLARMPVRKAGRC